MASFRLDSTDTSTLDDDLSAIIGEYSIPNLADITSESLLTKSQYAKVIFHDLLPCYPTDTDIWCRYSLTDGITSRHGDRVALYRVGWSSVHEHVQFEVAPITSNMEEKQFQVLFKAEALPKDTTEFYQLCYVNVDDSVCGASVPFQFRHPVEEELCEVEEQGGLLVVRSRTAINGEKLRDAAKMIDELELEKLVHEEKILALETTKDSLSMKLEELSSIQKREAQLQQDVQKLENEKTQAFANLQQADARFEELSYTVESLRKENSTLNELLKNESQKMVSNEISHYKIQIDNMQQMLDALTQSKEMASQALRCEQSKVMTLNIEHDKYKYRAQHLEDENNGLQLELQQEKNVVEALKLRLQQIEPLLQLKTKEHEGTLSKLQQLIKQIGQMQFELQQGKEHEDCLQLQLRQRDNRILMLDVELKDLQTKGDCFDQLNEEYTNLKRQLQQHNSVLSKAENLTQDNMMLQNQIKQLQEDVSLLLKSKEERDRLTSELELLTVNHLALQNELYTSSMNSTTVQELKEQNSSLQYRLQQLSTKETEINKNASSIEQLKYQLSAAEASNASLLHELKQIRELQPDWKVDCHNCRLLCTAAVAEALGDDVRCTTTFKAPVKNVLLKQMYQTLKDDKEKLEIELQHLVTQENIFRVRSDTINRRLLEIEEDVVLANSELNTVTVKNQRDKDDLVHINNRMASVQQQILRDDQKEGRDFNDNSDQNRLERMSKRCHDLQCSFSESASRIHDLQQNIQVLNQERVSLDDELKAKPWIEKRTAEEKCKILEKLVNLDQGLITIREDLFKQTEADLSRKSCTGVLLQFGEYLQGNFGLENSQSYEMRSTDLEECLKIHTEDTKISEEQVICQVENANTNVEGSACGLEVSTAGIEATCCEPIEKAVASGVRDGLIHGLNTLKQQAAGNLSPDSINTSTESLTNMERKCALADQVCQEKEKVLQDKLAVVLKDTVLKELLEGMQDLDLGKGVTEINTVAAAGIGGGEAELKLRLELAAEEYRKLYTQKLKLEKQLAKVQLKQVASARPRFPSPRCDIEDSGMVCPICGVSFPPTHSDIFTRHFEDHLS